MSCVKATQICVSQNGTPVLMARVEAALEVTLDTWDSVPVEIDDISRLYYVVVDLSDGNRESAGGEIDPSDVWFNDLQDGEIWTEDDTGFNFKMELNPTAIDEANHDYIVELNLILTSGARASWQYPISGTRRYGTDPSA